LAQVPCGPISFVSLGPASQRLRFKMRLSIVAAASTAAHRFPPAALPRKANPWHAQRAATSEAAAGRKAPPPPVACRPSPPASVGAVKLEVETPALLVELDALETNLAVLATMMEAFPDVRVRPHAKTHKSPDLAAVQMKQPQTVGVCCQKVSEAVALAATVGDVLLTNQIFSLNKALRLAKLARRGCSVAAVMDSLQGAEMMAKAARLEGVRIGALVELNIGQDRCGVDSPEQAVAFARFIEAIPELQFRGLRAYNGGAQHIRDYSERAASAAAAAKQAALARDALIKAGLGCEVVTGGGTGTFEFDAASGVYTEVHPGSYLFGDRDYAQNLNSQSRPCERWKQSLFVATTVISRSTASRRIVLDAGLKALSYDSGPPRVHGWQDSCAHVESGGDEHTVFHVNSGTALPGLGDQVLLVPGHCDPTVNLHDHLMAVRRGVVEAIWPLARGPGF